ncbi:hypothetical protein MTR_3g067455 [Medicago truncatula]|uniref:Uncharacterized protein n=1 Tax=Medicago truncatula TaxID=3880 RepID=A0A072UZT0_MEDTR|nr:hypothetical protein MTR_3g067455 [Medicago truncatula]
MGFLTNPSSTFNVSAGGYDGSYGDLYHSGSRSVYNDSAWWSATIEIMIGGKNKDTYNHHYQSNSNCQHNVTGCGGEKKWDILDGYDEMKQMKLGN